MKSISILATVAIVSPAALAEEAAPIEISISKEGAIALAGQTLTLDALAQQLATIAKKKEEAPVVVVTSSEKAPLEVATGVLDACRRAGITKIRLRSR